MNDISVGGGRPYPSFQEFVLVELFVMEAFGSIERVVTELDEAGRESLLWIEVSPQTPEVEEGFLLSLRENGMIKPDGKRIGGDGREWNVWAPTEKGHALLR